MGRAPARPGSCEDSGRPRRQNAEATVGLGSRGPPGTPAPGRQLQPEPRDPGPDLPRSAVCPHTKENAHICLPGGTAFTPAPSPSPGTPHLTHASLRTALSLHTHFVSPFFNSIVVFEDVSIA